MGESAYRPVRFNRSVSGSFMGDHGQPALVAAPLRCASEQIVMVVR
jgi:hypothetical protein